MSERKQIEAIEVEITPKRSLIKVSAIVCNVKPVRELESYTTELEKTAKDALEAIDLMIIDRDAFHNRNAELENKLNITVEALELIKRAKTIPKNGKIKYWSLDACRNFARIALNKLKRESE